MENAAISDCLPIGSVTPPHAQRSNNSNQGSAIQRKYQSERIDSFLDRRGKQWSVPGKLRKDLPMSKSISLVAAAIATLVVGLGIATTSNAQSPAQSSTSDQAYCHSLVEALRDEGTGTVRGLPVGNATAVAIAQCQEGDPGPAIPVLEQQLRGRDITLPTRS
jgi:hypothetical protein